MKACPNKKGQIADAAEVGLSARDSPYVCIYLMCLTCMLIILILVSIILI